MLSEMPPESNMLMCDIGAGLHCGGSQWVDSNMVHSKRAFSAGFSNGFMISESPMYELELS